MGVPSSVILARELPETYICRYCHVEWPADAGHFFPHRASGGLHLKSRCRACEKRYRAELAAATAKGQREIRHRPRSTEAVLSLARSDDARPWTPQHTTTNAAPDHPGRSSFHDRYRALEDQFRAQAEADGAAYLPNVEPLGPVSYVFLTMEPSLSWAVNPDDALAKVARGFRNFARDDGPLLLQHAIRRYLGTDSYHLTDLSKGAMWVADADAEREARYERWHSLLLAELALVGPDAPVYAVGRAVAEHLRTHGIPIARDRPLLHYSVTGARHRLTVVRGREAEFGAFCATVTRADLLATADAIYGRMPAWVRDPAIRYAEQMELTRSRLALLFTYKVAFEDRP
jgi:hypothetical protein